MAIDLARTGIGRLDLVDDDEIDVNAASRQLAPYHDAGGPKVHVVADAIRMNSPYCDVSGYMLGIAHLWDPRLDIDPKQRQALNRLRAAIQHADLLIDASANPAASRYLAALRQAVGAPYLNVAATAGAWGGLVALLTEETGCWACVEHHRADGTLPVPPADPDGWIAPAGCAELTFLGDNPSLATVAHHGSRAAIGHLTGDPISGNYWVASMRDENGPVPASWVTSEVTVHPACPCHPETGHGTAP